MQIGNLERLILSPMMDNVKVVKLDAAMKFLIDNGLVSIRKDGGYWERYLDTSEEGEALSKDESKMQLFIDEVHRKEKEAKEAAKAEKENKRNITIENYHQSIVSKGDNVNQNVTQCDLSSSLNSRIINPPNKNEDNAINTSNKKPIGWWNSPPNRTVQIITAVISLISILVVIYYKNK